MMLMMMMMTMIMLMIISLIQGAFDVIQGTFDVIQGTFDVIQKKNWRDSRNIWRDSDDINKLVWSTWAVDALVRRTRRIHINRVTFRTVTPVIEESGQPCASGHNPEGSNEHLILVKGGKQNATCVPPVQTGLSIKVQIYSISPAYACLLLSSLHEKYAMCGASPSRAIFRTTRSRS
jgi:hypothetical protein